MDEQQDLDGVGQAVGAERTMSARMCNIFNKLRLNGELCDLVIEAEGMAFNAHKIILCGCSPYFRVLFISGFSKTQQTPGVYRIPGVSADAMRLLIEYAYTRHLEVTRDNVQLLLVAADQFNIMGGVRACSSFLGRQLCVENAVGIWQLTGHYLLPALRQQAYLYILRRFPEVARESEEFLELSPEQLGGILGEDTLNVTREEVVFEAVLRWISHDHEGRRGHVSQLLLKVRLCLMNTGYFLSHVTTNPLVSGDERCGPVVAEALRVTSGLAADRPPLDFRGPLTRPRLPHAVLLAVGGWSGGPTNSVESYDAPTDRWVSVAVGGEEPRTYQGTVLLRGCLYCVGGFDGSEFLNSVRRFDPATGLWHQAAPMHSRHCYVSAVVLDGCIFAMGGYDGHTRLNSVERYEPDNNQWSLVASMHEHRSDASASTLGNMKLEAHFTVTDGDSSFAASIKEKIWTDLSKRYQDDEISAFLEEATIMDPRFKSKVDNNEAWHRLKTAAVKTVGPELEHQLPAGQEDCAESDCETTQGQRTSVSVSDQEEEGEEEIVEVGGFDGESRLSSADAYSPATGAWRPVPSMISARGNFGLAVLGELLYVVGGHDGLSTTFNAERYDDEAERWSSVRDMTVFWSRDWPT
ncbi:hypothetical protein NHX12_034451 [Muraenolepis orangiensis]|uniref:BTB domain-containing protein n=1 Tax=Muraenolepis orangiensis TaxID=630683 RepID=A0A9Q0D6Y5_9TELE|nr:hypothetical protein NHX12_034451 [Muraenolepis orangiensis]